VYYHTWRVGDVLMWDEQATYAPRRGRLPSGRAPGHAPHHCLPELGHGRPDGGPAQFHAGKIGEPDNPNRGENSWAARALLADLLLVRSGLRSRHETCRRSTYLARSVGFSLTGSPSSSIRFPAG